MKDRLLSVLLNILLFIIVIFNMIFIQCIGGMIMFIILFFVIWPIELIILIPCCIIWLLTGKFYGFKIEETLNNKFGIFNIIYAN